MLYLTFFLASSYFKKHRMFNVINIFKYYQLQIGYSKTFKLKPKIKGQNSVLVSSFRDEYTTISQVWYSA